MYLFEHTWEQERRRLNLLEEVFDAGTQGHLGRILLPPGGQCLEVGAGAGSIALWMCDQVGPDGRVVATDLDTDFLETLTEKNLEVRRHDIVSDELEEETFDLIHARLVLEHIPEREAVLHRLVTALRPGGWLVIEDFDWGSMVVAPGCAGGGLLQRAHDGVRSLFTAVGYHPEYGRELPLRLRAAGLVGIGTEGKVHVGLAGSATAAWWQMTIGKFGPAFLDHGVLTEVEVAEMVAAFDHDEISFQLPTLVTAWGQRPLPT